VRRFKTWSEAHKNRIGGLCGGCSSSFIRSFSRKSVRKKISKFWTYFRKIRKRSSYLGLKKYRRLKFSTNESSEKIFYSNFKENEAISRSERLELKPDEQSTVISSLLSSFLIRFLSAQGAISNTQFVGFQDLKCNFEPNYNFWSTEPENFNFFENFLYKFWDDYSVTCFSYQKLKLNFASCEFFLIDSIIIRDNFFDSVYKTRSPVNSKIPVDFKITKFENKSLLLIHCDRDLTLGDLNLDPDLSYLIKGKSVDDYYLLCEGNNWVSYRSRLKGGFGGDYDSDSDDDEFEYDDEYEEEETGEDEEENNEETVSPPGQENLRKVSSKI
jgi:hypothetical protein